MASLMSLASWRRWAGTEILRILLKHRDGLGHFTVAFLHQPLLGFELLDFRVDRLESGQGQGKYSVEGKQGL